MPQKRKGHVEHFYRVLCGDLAGGVKRDMAKCLFEGGMNGLVIGIAV